MRPADYKDIEAYQDHIRQMYATFGGAFDLELIETLVQTVVVACNKAWMEKLLPSLAPSNDLSLPPTEDLSVLEVQKLIQWAEEKMYTPGVIRGDRRRAAGIELLRVGVKVLRGEMQSPSDLGSQLQKLTVPA